MNSRKYPLPFLKTVKQNLAEGAAPDDPAPGTGTWGKWKVSGAKPGFSPGIPKKKERFFLVRCSKKEPQIRTCLCPLNNPPRGDVEN